MAIIQSVSVSDFRDAFRLMGRQDSFSYTALGALFDYHDDLSDDLGEPWELDVIAICCDWSEYDSALEAAGEYGWQKPEQEQEDHDPEIPSVFWTDAESDDDYAERCESEALEWLRDQTTVLELDSGAVVVLSF